MNPGAAEMLGTISCVKRKNGTNVQTYQGHQSLDLFFKIYTIDVLSGADTGPCGKVLKLRFLEIGLSGILRPSQRVIMSHCFVI